MASITRIFGGCIRPLQSRWLSTSSPQAHELLTRLTTLFPRLVGQFPSDSKHPESSSLLHRIVNEFTHEGIPSTLAATQMRILDLMSKTPALANSPHNSMRAMELAQVIRQNLATPRS
jgi:hypothetical protein